jgi:hypothetical protein
MQKSSEVKNINSAILSAFVLAAITKDYRLSGLTNRTLFLTVLEVGKSKIKVLADLVSAKATLLGFQTATFSLYPHMIEKRSSGVSSSSYNGINPIVGPLHS